jgi:ketopantoate reductase
MKKTVVVIGIGEIGGVFARGILKTGHPVYPVTRGIELSDAVKDVPDPEAVIIAVGEKDIHNILGGMPRPWQDRIVLVQNELLPRDWRMHNIDDPTVISVWFEKKKGRDAKVIIPSPVFGSHADLVQTALRSIDISCHVLPNPDELLFELVLKNVYILTVNIAGLKVGGTVGELWENHRALANDVAGDIMDIQFRLCEKDLDRLRLIDGMVNAFNGDLDHKCLGRSAPARLQRAICQADEFGFETKTLRAIYKHREQASV